MSLYMPTPKCIFMGSDPIALPLLDSLVQDCSELIRVDAVFTQPDRKTGRGKKLTPNAIKTWASANDVPVHQPEKLDSSWNNIFKENDWQFAIVMAYGHLIRKSLLDIPKLGFYNLHASLLPRLRGASPIETAITVGEQKTGVTLMKMVPALDAGPMLAKIDYSVDPEENALQLREKLANLCPELMRIGLTEILSGEPHLVEQNPEQATYCRKIDKDDGWIDFDLTPEEILNQVRGLFPWPGAFFNYQGIRLKIGTATPASRPSGFEAAPNGLLIQKDKSLIICCEGGALFLDSIQKPGGKLLPVKEFLNGFSVDAETQLTYPARFDFVRDSYFKKP